MITTENNSTTSQENIDTQKAHYAYSENLNNSNTTDSAQILQEAENFSYKKELIISSTTAAISALPAILKVMSSKDDGKPPLSYSDVVDFMCNQMPTVMNLMYEITKEKKGFLGGINKCTKYAKIIAKIGPVIPFIKAIKTNMNVHDGQLELDKDLILNTAVFASNVLIPFLLKNKNVEYAFNVLIKGPLMNALISLGLNSNNKLIRSVTSMIPPATVFVNKAKNAMNELSNDRNTLEYDARTGTYSQTPVNQISTEGASPGFKNFVDKTANFLHKAGNNRIISPYSNTYYSPYGQQMNNSSYYNNGYQNGSIFGGPGI